MPRRERDREIARRRKRRKERKKLQARGLLGSPGAAKDLEKKRPKKAAVKEMEVKVAKVKGTEIKETAPEVPSEAPQEVTEPTTPEG